MRNLDMLLGDTGGQLQNNIHSTANYRKATVVEMAPLRIHLDGDPGPLSIPPDRLGTAAVTAVGQRVLVLVLGRQLIVVGVLAESAVVVGGLPPANSTTITGTYAGTAAAADGYPYATDREAMLEVTNANNHVYQRLTYAGYPYATYTRRGWPADGVPGWSDWRGLDQPEVVSTSDGGVAYKYGDGQLVIKHRCSFPANANTEQSWLWTYPVPFVGDWPQVMATPRTTAPQRVSLGYVEGSTPLTSGTISFYRTTDIGTGVELMAIGRWR